MNKKGFTLLETIIYIALFSVLMAGVIVAVFNIFSSNDRNQISVSIQEEGTFVARKLSWALTSASNASTTSTSTLVITRPDLSAQSPLTLTESAKRLTLARGTGAGMALTGARFIVSSTTFLITPAASGIATSVKMTYRINGVPFIYKSYLKN